MLPLALAGVGLAAKGYNMYQASQREKQAMNALKDLAKTPYAKYGVNPLVQRYTQMGLRDIQNPQGFSGAETGAFNQGLAQSQAGARQNALSIGGSSVSRAVNAGLNSANLGALNQFAGQNAALARQNRNLGFNRYMQGAGIAQNVDNMNTQGELNRRMMLEQAYGAAARQNRDIFSQGLEGMGNDLLGVGLYKGLNEGFMGNTNVGNITNRLRYKLGGYDSDSTLQSDQMNAVGKGFTNLPNQVTGFYGNPRVPKLPVRGLNGSISYK